MHFDCHHLDHWCTDIEQADYLIAAYCEPHLIWVVRFWPIRDHRFSVCNVLSSDEWYFVVLDKHDGVCPFSTWYALGKAFKFFGV